MEQGPTVFSTGNGLQKCKGCCKSSQACTEALHENKWSLSVRKQTLHRLLDHRHPAQPSGALDFIFLAEFKKESAVEEPGVALDENTALIRAVEAARHKGK